MFEQVRARWEQYCDRYVTNTATAQFQLADEVGSRLEQLDLLLRHLDVAIEARAQAFREGRSEFEAWAEIVLFAEAFYFFAWRLREIVTRVGGDALPEMKGVDFRGVNRVRNQLIEHPEDNSRRFARHFALGSEGPVLKPTGRVAGE